MQRHFTRWKLWPAGGARCKFCKSPKSSQFRIPLDKFSRQSIWVVWRYLTQNKKCQRTTKVTEIDSLQNLNVCTKFRGSQFNGCWDILICFKVVDRLTDVVIHRPMPQVAINTTAQAAAWVVFDLICYFIRRQFNDISAMWMRLLRSKQQ